MMNCKLIISSKKTAQFLYKSLSEYLDNVSIVVEITKHSSFWSVFSGSKLLYECNSETASKMWAHDIIMREVNKGVK